MLVASILEDWTSRRSKRVFSLVGDALDALGDRHALDLLRLLEGGARLRAGLTDGVDLVTFLKGAVSVAEGDVDVCVTGHSKGGALASAVALRLASSRGDGNAVPQEYAWDPKGRATVRCFSYAGPTAGNKKFAACFDAMLGKTSVRVASKLDVVPHAWTDGDLEKIPTLYAPGVGELPLLAELVAAIRSQLKSLRYAHPQSDVEWLSAEVDRHKKLYFKQLVHQHLDGYLRAMKLGPGISQRTFFDLLA
jgi:hypothetical protein